MPRKKERHLITFQKFRTVAEKYPDYLFCFFEGNDEMYYAERIKLFTEKYKSIACGGRARLLKVHELIRENKLYEKYKTAFFIDRDFKTKALLAQNPPIFETKTYAIENLYVSENVFAQILEKFFQISSQKETTKDTFHFYVNLYKKRQKEFHEASLLLNAWYACVMEQDAKIGKKQISFLQERSIFKRKDGSDGGKNFLNFIDCSLQEIKQDYDITRIRKTFLRSTEIETSVLQQKMAAFKTKEAYKIFRGKFELQFLVRFICLMLQDDIQILHNSPIGDGRYLKNEDALRLFSKYAETPKALLNYLKQVTQTLETI